METWEPIRRSHTFAPEVPHRLLGESTAFLKVFFYQTGNVSMYSSFSLRTVVSWPVDDECQ